MLGQYVTANEVRDALAVERDSVSARQYMTRVWRGEAEDRVYLRLHGKDIGYVAVRNGEVRTGAVTRGRADVELLLCAAGIKC